MNCTRRIFPLGLSTFVFPIEWIEKPLKAFVMYETSSAFLCAGGLFTVTVGDAPA